MTVNKHICQPCRINGRVYPSQKAAAAALGVCQSAISAAITRGRLRGEAPLSNHPRRIFFTPNTKDGNLCHISRINRA